MGSSKLVTNDDHQATSHPIGPAFYARRRVLRSRQLGDWWTLLHPPYTLWHLAYVVIGGCLAAPANATILMATLLAFFLAVGVCAHALDELQGRPLGTSISSRVLVVTSTTSLCGAAVLGVLGIMKVGPGIAPFVGMGIFLVLAYNLEWFRGCFHTDVVFALAWGTFPLLTSYVAQHDNVSLGAGIASAAAFFLSLAQRKLSTPARSLRRRTRSVEGTVITVEGESEPITLSRLLQPLDEALRTMSWAVISLGTALAVIRFNVL